MQKPVIGSLPPAGEVGRRDAFHVAAIVARCYGGELYPGQSIRFLYGAESVTASLPGETRHGVVDPFLDGAVPAGTLFWVIPDPKLIGALGHTFEITGFPRPRTIEIPDGVDESQLQCAIEGC